MTIKEASERYNIPMEILREYESWGLFGQHRLRAVFYREFVSEPAHKARRKHRGAGAGGRRSVFEAAVKKVQARPSAPAN